MKLDTGTANPDHKFIPVIIETQSIMTHTGVIPDHTIRSTEDTTGVVHDAHTPPLTTISPAATHHITDLLLQAYHALDQPTHPPEKVCIDPLLIPADHEAKHISLGTPE